jgi:hypothetical protein
MTQHVRFDHPVPGFSERLATIDNVLPEGQLAQLAGLADRLIATERTYLPAHKKGGTVAYQTLEREAPEITRLYRSPLMQQFISRVTGTKIQPTPLHDQSSCSLLFYEKPGDHIGWHYDHNFYKGRHFTVLIPLINNGQGEDGLSAARLLVKRGRSEIMIATPPNRLIVFEGARVRHKVTPIAGGERRVVWSMTYCADPRNSTLQGMARRIKDTAFFGVRALWT